MITDEVKIVSKGGTVIVGSSGITFKGKVKIKGSLVIIGGAPDGLEPFDTIQTYNS